MLGTSTQASDWRDEISFKFLQELKGFDFIMNRLGNRAINSVDNIDQQQNQLMQEMAEMMDHNLMSQALMTNL